MNKVFLILKQKNKNKLLFLKLKHEISTLNQRRWNIFSAIKETNLSFSLCCVLVKKEQKVKLNLVSSVDLSYAAI